VVGALVLLSSATFSNAESTVAVQFAGTTPAAVLIPPSRCCLNSGSLYEPAAWPIPVAQTRPPSASRHHEIGWSYPIASGPGL
jgi:hypothetical protein